MIRKEIINNELYVYFGMKLIYKKWIDTGLDRVFHESEGLSQFYKWPDGFIANQYGPLLGWRQ